jgi:hypothetical protein
MNPLTPGPSPPRGRGEIQSVMFSLSPFYPLVGDRINQIVYPLTPLGERGRG